MLLRLLLADAVTALHGRCGRTVSQLSTFNRFADIGPLLASAGVLGLAVEGTVHPVPYGEIQAVSNRTPWLGGPVEVVRGVGPLGDGAAAPPEDAGLAGAAKA